MFSAERGGTWWLVSFICIIPILSGNAFSQNSLQDAHWFSHLSLLLPTKYITEFLTCSLFPELTWVDKKKISQAWCLTPE